MPRISVECFCGETNPEGSDASWTTITACGHLFHTVSHCALILYRFGADSSSSGRFASKNGFDAVSLNRMQCVQAVVRSSMESPRVYRASDGNRISCDYIFKRNSRRMERRKCRRSRSTTR